jgi:hypothetical protein
MNSKLKQGKTLTEEKTVSFKPRPFMKSLMEQNYTKLVKAKEKFVDDLFPPEHKSIHSGNVSKKEETKVAEIPSFIKVEH